MLDTRQPLVSWNWSDKFKILASRSDSSSTIIPSKDDPFYLIISDCILVYIQVCDVLFALIADSRQETRPTRRR